MAFQNPGMRAIYQNWLQPAWSIIDVNVTSPCQTGYEAEHVMDWMPSRPARFEFNNPSGGAEYKDIGFFLGASMFCDAVAIIDARSYSYTATSGDIQVMRALEFQLAWSSNGSSYTTVWPSSGWAGLSTDETDEWGANLFGYFTQPASPYRYWRLRVRLPDGSPNITDASIGCVLLGKHYAFENNPGIPHDRATTVSTLYTGRGGGGIQAFLREESRRLIGLDVFLSTDTNRSALERLIAGRGRRTNVTTQAALKRLDLPTAVILPEMWKSTTLNYGGCVYGSFGGLTTRSLAGGGAIARLELAEII